VIGRIPVLALAVLAGMIAARAETAPPQALVTALYRLPDDASPFFQTTDRKRVDRYFTKPLADLIWKDAQASKGEVGAIDGSPIYDAQDYEPKGLKIVPAAISGDAATVTVTFTNYGEKKKILYRFTRAGGGSWRIADIVWAPDRTLLGVLRATYP
jgi:hypothetical protein